MMCGMAPDAPHGTNSSARKAPRRPKNAVQMDQNTNDGSTWDVHVFGNFMTPMRKIGWLPFGSELTIAYQWDCHPKSGHSNTGLQQLVSTDGWKMYSLLKNITFLGDMLVFRGVNIGYFLRQIPKNLSYHLRRKFDHSCHENSQVVATLRWKAKTGLNPTYARTWGPSGSVKQWISPPSAKKTNCEYGLIPDFSYRPYGWFMLDLEHSNWWVHVFAYWNKV